MAKKLGKGLEALIKTYSSDKMGQYLQEGVPINNIIPNKNQPRQTFNQEEMNSLIASVKKMGILQPISIRQISNKLFEIIAGERRYRAAKEAGLKTIPAYIININSESEMMEYALIENIQRVDLNPIEEAEGYAILSGKYNLTHAKISEGVSKSRTEVSNKLRLLNLPPVVKDSLRLGYIEYGHARALLGLKESTKILKIFKLITKTKLNVRQTENLIKKISGKGETKLSKIYKTSFYNSAVLDLQKYLKTNVLIKKNKKNGKIIIEFENDENLNEIISKIKKT